MNSEIVTSGIHLTYQSVADDDSSDVNGDASGVDISPNKVREAIYETILQIDSNC
jgi:hypothetical protein